MRLRAILLSDLFVEKTGHHIAFVRNGKQQGQGSSHISYPLAKQDGPVRRIGADKTGFQNGHTVSSLRSEVSG